MYIYEKNKLKLTTLQVVFNAGSLYEKEGRYGTMHLMEHLICKSFSDMQSMLKKEGISWNAYTSDEHVVFYWSGLDSHLTPELKRMLVDRILGNIDMISVESFTNERSTVLQEYGDSFNDPQSGKCLNVLREKFNYYAPIGKRVDVNNFTIDDMREVKLEFFSKPARIIEVGPTKTDFSQIKYEEYRHEFKTLKFKQAHASELEEIYKGDKTCVICIGNKLIKKSDYPFLEIAFLMLSSGLESALYQEIRVKRGLSYYSRAYSVPLINESIYIFSACTENKRVDELKNVYSEIIENVDKYLTEDRFNNIISSLNIRNETKKILRYDNMRDLTRKDCIQLPKNINKITFDKVVGAAKKYINQKNMVIVC